MAKKQKKQFIFLDCGINDETSVEILQKLQEVKESGSTPCLCIQSFGGSSASGIFLYDQIRLHHPNIIIVASSTIQSIALNILTAAKLENRLATENCSYFFHEMWVRKKGKKITRTKRFDTLKPKAKEDFLLFDNICRNIIVNNTKLSIKKLTQMEEAETFVNNQDAVKIGLISRIISSLDEI